MVTCVLSGFMILAMTSVCLSKPPNILILMADDVGIGDIGCFGNDTIRTPNIDSIAEQGVRFTHDMATASICTPSRSAFQTGRYAARMGMVPHNFIRVHVLSSCTGGLPPEEITIGELAKSKGYATALIGKWHLGISCGTRDDFCHHPNKQGYDHYYGMITTNMKDFGVDGETVANDRFPNRYPRLVGTTFAAVLLILYLKNKGYIGFYIYIIITFFTCVPFLFTTYIRLTGPRFNGIIMRNLDVVEQPVILRGLTDRLVNEGVQFLDERAKDQKPFLLVMSWIQAHTALHATRPFRGRSAHGIYGDDMEEMDWSVGEILKALEARGFAEDTLVYFTSDHGGHLEEKDIHGNQAGGWNGIYKGSKGQGGTEGGFRVPTVARWPGVIPKGSTINVPTSHLDVFPTIASVIGAEVPQDRIIDGVDILPLLKGQSGVVPPHQFFVHYCGHLIHAARYVPGNGDDVYKALYATHNYIPGTFECEFLCYCTGSGVTWHDPPILYNVAKDLSEDHPLDPNDPKNRAIINTMNRLVNEHKASIEPVQDQFAYKHLAPRPWLQMCCNFPFCTCTESEDRRFVFNAELKTET